MINVLQNKTPEHYRARPFSKKASIAGTPLRDIRDGYLDVQYSMGTAKPEDEAAAFYLLNHVFSVVGQKGGDKTPLNGLASLADQYYEVGGKVFIRLFYYTLLICTRESRHMKNSSSVVDKLEAKYGKTILDFWRDIRGTSSGTAVGIFKKHAPDVSLGEYTAFMFEAFDKGGYSPGYGGKAWAEVAKNLNNFVQGDISAEIMVDTGFTLAHNNGPIFNKGLLYAMYSSKFVSLLDVQRGGQIPNLIYDLTKGRDYLKIKFSAEVKLMLKHAQEKLPGEFDRPTDWQQIADLGAVSGVSEYLHKQKLFFPDSAVNAKFVGEMVQIDHNNNVKQVKRNQL